MTAPRQKEQEQSAERQERDKVKSGIREHVIRALGTPVGLHEVQVRRLWDDHYRVNILVGTDITTLKIAHSYFLVVNAVGAILSSTPKIANYYDRAAKVGLVLTPG